jgi:hypothetical protein
VPGLLGDESRRSAHLPEARTRLKKMRRRPGRLDGFIAATGDALAPP